MKKNQRQIKEEKESKIEEINSKNCSFQYLWYRWVGGTRKEITAPTFSSSKNSKCLFREEESKNEKKKN